jgi:hypothetical protein
MKPSRVRFPRASALAVALALAAWAAPATAQETGETREEARAAPQARDQRIVEVKHADPTSLARVLSVFPVHVQAHPDLGLLTIRGGQEDVAAAAEAAARLDLPPAPTRSIEIVAHVLGASKTEDLPGGVPAGLEEVARQLREVFGYRGVELVDSVVVRARDRAEAQVSGVMAAGLGEAMIPYQLGFNRVSVVDGSEDGIRIDGLLFEARINTDEPVGDPPEGVRSRSDLVRLITDLDLKVDQKAVVGKAAAGAESQGLILVLEARVLD